MSYKKTKYLLFLFIAMVNYVSAQNVFDNRDTIRSILLRPTSYGFVYWTIEEDVNDNERNYLLASSYLHNDYSSPRLYFMFYFNAENVCTKAVRYIPNENFGNDMSFYRSLSDKKIVNLSAEGIKYAWIADDSLKIVAYFDPDLSFKFETHYAITFEPFYLYDKNLKPDKKTSKKK